MFSQALVSVKQDDITLSFGPLFTNICNRCNCTTVLFYQVPVDDYFGPEVQSSASMMVAVWLPLLAGLILTRLTRSIFHAPAQMLVSISYSGLLYILVSYEKYTLGSALIVIIIRAIYTSLVAAILSLILLARFTIIRFNICDCGPEEPILVGVDYTTDASRQEFWDPKITPLRSEYDEAHDDKKISYNPFVKGKKYENIPF
jgi:hypothetical protein